MNAQKIIRTVCLFTDRPGSDSLARLDALADRLTMNGWQVQTRRLCSPDSAGVLRLDHETDGSVYLSLGSLNLPTAEGLMTQFLKARNVAFNLDLTGEEIAPRHVELLFEIIAQEPAKTFSFAYTFHNPPSTPFFPSAAYAENGFAVGLQPTDLSEGCETIGAWLDRMAAAWQEIDDLFGEERDYLGVDTSVAPLFEGHSSLLAFIKRMGYSLERAATSNLFLTISRALKAEGGKKTGLCGLFFPTLEDFELAEEYDRGNYPIERSVYISLHSGLGIDTYPIGVDEKPERVLEVLQLLQGLAEKYRKPLSARFISDGKTPIGEKASFGNQYLKDVTIRAL